MKSKSLAETHPEVAKQWHPTKNGDLSPKDFTHGTHKKVWWKCDKEDDHEWISSIGNRTSGSNCPICRGLKVVNSNCLATVNPLVSKQWHPKNNVDLTPFEVTVSSSKKVWWKCDKGDDHEWISSIGNRTNRKSTCPFCNGNKVALSNCLATIKPKLANQWHPTLNGDLTPNDVTVGSQKKVWWKCTKGDDHEWISYICNRKNSKFGCPICSGHKVVLSTCLATTHSEIAKEWHPTKNRDLTPYNVKAGVRKKVWWKCDKGDDHEWISSIGNRTNHKSGCAVCAGWIITKSTCLATTHPEITKEWHPTKNGDLTPYNVKATGNNKVWWKCDKGDDHEWPATPGNRIGNGSGCSVCANITVVLSNCLVTTHPEIAKEWHPTKNRELTPYDVLSGSNKKVWWKCDKGDDHEWSARLVDRLNKHNCPFCTLTPQSKQELTITFELIKFFKDINPKGFKTRVKGKLWSIDIYIPQLKLGVEFDGSYWHKDKRALDKLKTEKLEEKGFEIFRVREEPLKRIFEDDIMSKKPFNAKQLTNDILTQIMSRYTLDAKKINKIKSYIQLSDLQNEKGLDKYIDKILTEKAEKNLLKDEEVISK